MNNKYYIKKDEYYCNECNKKYKTYKTLWEHTKKFHTKNVQECSLNVLNFSKKSLVCEVCNKIFKLRSAKSMHKKKCTLNEEEKIKYNNKQIELDLLVAKEKILQHEKEILKLKLKLEKSTKIDNITLKQLNKKLMKRNNLIKNSTVISNSNNNNKIQNNNIVNNFQLVGFSKEDVVELLTMQEKNKL